MIALFGSTSTWISSVLVARSLLTLIRSGRVLSEPMTAVVAAATSSDLEPLTTTLIPPLPVMLCCDTSIDQPSVWTAPTSALSVFCSASRSTLLSRRARIVAEFGAAPVKAAARLDMPVSPSPGHRRLDQVHFAVLLENRLDLPGGIENACRRRAGRRRDGDAEVLLRAGVEELGRDVRGEQSRAQRLARRRCRSRPSANRGSGARP